VRTARGTTSRTAPLVPAGAGRSPRRRGGLLVHDQGNCRTKVEVSRTVEGVGLRLSNARGQMNVLLLPEDVEPLCRELIAARSHTDPAEVEHTREWIGEYRGDDDE
jgi:hypothetical protein